MNNLSKIAISVAAGAAAGAVLGILFAPEKGSELRRKINERGKKITNAVKEKFQAHNNKPAEKTEVVS